VNLRSQEALTHEGGVDASFLIGLLSLRVTRFDTQRQIIADFPTNTGADKFFPNTDGVIFELKKNIFHRKAQSNARLRGPIRIESLSD